MRSIRSEALFKMDLRLPQARIAEKNAAIASYCIPMRNGNWIRRNKIGSIKLIDLLIQKITQLI
jgi:hypothetical protein